MKKITIVFALFLSTIIFSQKNKFENPEIKITKISYEVEDIEELKTIDWENIKEVFNNNTKNEDIQMDFALIHPNFKYKTKSTINIAGKSKNVDSLIILAKKGIQSIIKISNKVKN